ncbi:ABC-three component system middle component 6 [Streptomyces sp. 73]|uniref:ABC-three component system middle component 6 n=1 Tax=Streptomyces spiralis TaxID=66376 RepID=UPI000C70A466
MLLPTKGISAERALLTVAAQTLKQIDGPVTVSQAWARFREWREREGFSSPIPFWWFAYALDVLFAIGRIEVRDGVIVRKEGNASPTVLV